MVATVTVGLLHHKALPCKWKTHDEHAPEYGMIDGPVCPACLQFLWSSHRVRLHLMYMPRDGSPNQCYQYLQSIGFTTTPACVPLPSRRHRLVCPCRHICAELYVLTPFAQRAP